MGQPALFRLTAMCLGLVAGVGLLEIGFRFVSFDSTSAVDPPVRSLRPAIAWASEATPWYRRLHGRAVHTPRVGLVPFGVANCDSELAPDASPTCGEGRQNSHGFRMPEFTSARPPDTFRIVIVGDSFTWGDGVGLDDTYHRQFQRLYDRVEGERSARIEVIALGINGSSFADNVGRLLVYGESLAPDLVLVQFYDNDLEYGSILNTFDPENDASDIDFMLDSTVVGRLLRARLRGRERSQLWLAGMERIYESGSAEWHLFTSELGTLARWRVEHQIPVAFLSFPSVDIRGNGSNFEYVQDSPATLPLLARAERAIADGGFPLLQVSEVFRVHAGDQFLAVSESNAHYGPAGNRLVAEAVVEFLDDADWIDFGVATQREADERWAAERALRTEAGERWSEYHQRADLQLGLFTRLIELFPEYPWLRLDLARIQQLQADYAGCRATYQRLAELAPDFAVTDFHLSSCTEGDASRDDLLVGMLEVLPDHTGALERLARADVDAGRLDRACGCYARLAEVSTYADQHRLAIDALQQLACDQSTALPCPGRDPIETLDAVGAH